MSESIQKVNPTSHAEVVNLKIEGMTCASCVGRVERVLKKLPDVQTAVVNLATKQAQVTFNASSSLVHVVSAIEEAGYQVVVPHIQVAVSDMTCASCVARVERALKRLPNVHSVAVNLTTEQATVSGFVSESDVIWAIEDAGYGARSLQQQQDEHAAWQARKALEQAHWQRDFVWALILTLPVFVLEMGGHVWPPFHHWIGEHVGMQNSWYVQALSSALVLAFPGRRFIQTGLPAFFKGAPDMNSLVAVGSLAAFAFSMVATFWPQLLPAGSVHVYFEAAAVIVTLILLGRFLEARAKSHTSDAIASLLRIQAKTAQVLRNDQTHEIPIADVVVGDVVMVKPGERVAVDGVVVTGDSWVDESMITGEPIPVAKTIGDQLTAGTVNGNRQLQFQATAVGDATVLAQIIRMVSDAQSGKLPIQALVDKVTLWFVPAVMVLAVITLCVWWVFSGDLSMALVNAVAVLIIACPCAMGLATPTSIMVASGRGAQLGVLFRKGEALQTLHEVGVVALDKTGTLTEGKPVLTDWVLQDAFEWSEVLALVAAAESQSEHPIAKALVNAAQEQNLVLPHIERFEALTGWGLNAATAEHTVQIGADRYMSHLGLDVGVFGSHVSTWANAGKTPLYVAIDGQLAAMLAVSDPIKTSTPTAIAALQALGLQVVMVSGDNRQTAQAIGRTLGIDEVVAEVMPEGKVAVIQSLQKQHKVAFVGDGMNDAPALAQADVGLAVGTGTDVAIEAADVVLMSGRLTAVSEAMALSRATMNNIRQNLFWAFAYNVALIPIAAGVLYPFWGVLLSPMLAAGAMALSSVFVLGNALRLKRFLK